MTDQAPPLRRSVAVGDRLSWMRTQMALQNTLMAAVRTAVSLIGFGFTVAQFFQKLMGEAAPGPRRLSEEAPRNFGLVLIGAGVLSLAIFTFQYHAANRHLRSGDYAALAADRTKNSGSYLVAFAVLLIGLAAFSSVLLRF